MKRRRLQNISEAPFSSSTAARYHYDLLRQHFVQAEPFRIPSGKNHSGFNTPNREFSHFSPTFQLEKSFRTGLSLSPASRQARHREMRTPAVSKRRLRGPPPEKTIQRSRWGSWVPEHTGTPEAGSGLTHSVPPPGNEAGGGHYS